MTQHVHGKRGRLLTSTTTVTREVEWDEQEQGWMLALAESEALTCTGCGGWLPETTAADNEYRYELPEPTVCHGCKIQATAQDMRIKDSDSPLQALRWPIAELKRGGET